jgi:nitrate/nitrite transporter NarK
MPNKSLTADSLIAVSVDSNLKCYLQLALLLGAGGGIYAVIYMRQNFENTLLQAFGISSSDLGQLYSMLGLVFALSYGPSGWLADRFSPRVLISFSMLAVGMLGLWFSSYPSKSYLIIIFICWGLASGLTFWAALIKSVKLLAKPDEQGRFFGILDGGRGLVEASVATAGLSLFAWMSHQGALPQASLQPVIYLYSFTSIAIGLLVFLFLDIADDAEKAGRERAPAVGLIQGFKLLLPIPELWLMASIVFCGYQLFWATYFFSAYLQVGYGMSAVTAGVITVAKLWMRPIGGIGGGFLGDRFSGAAILSISMLLASLGLILLVALPGSAGVYAFLPVVLLIGVMTFAVRGLYWSLLDKCEVPQAVTGLAIGIVSVLGYLPDIFLPLLHSAVLEYYPGAPGFRIYFLYIAAMGLLGSMLALRFRQVTKASGK